MINTLKKPLSIIIIIILIAGALGGYYYFTRPKKTVYEYTTVQKGNLTQEVSVTGKVKPASTIALAFERSGKIIQAGFRVGQKVQSGQILAALENSDIRAQLLQAQAGIQAQQAKLDELEKGTRPEEIQVAETSVINYQKVLDDAKVSLETTKNNADANLQSVYNGALTAGSKSVSVALNSLFVITDLQYDHFSAFDQNSMQVENAKAPAVQALLGVSGAGRATKDAFNSLTGGAKASAQAAQTNPSNQNIDQALADIANALQKVKTALEAVPMISDLSSTDTTNLSTEKSSINTEIITIANKQQSIEVQKTTNRNSIASAEASVTSAQNNLASAQANLNLKRAGNTPEQIAAQEAQVRQSEANMKNIQATLSKTIIQAPVNGIITLQDAKVGETAAPNKIIISIIADAKFEIEANIPEADIAKVKVGDSASMTLDAYGNDVVFPAKATAIDPAETIIEGIATYKTKLQFINEDERIKSGMTANIDILTDKRENALVIPQRAVIAKNNEKFVLLDVGKIEPSETKIETGLKGSDGMVEILSGLKKGDRIVGIGGKIGNE